MPISFELLNTFTTEKNQNFYKTHRRLQNNYRILRRYATNQSTEYNLSELNRQGFRPSSITGVERGFNGSLPKYYLYDIGYQFLNPEKIKIFKRANVD